MGKKSILLKYTDLILELKYRGYSFTDIAKELESHYGVVCTRNNVCIFFNNIDKNYATMKEALFRETIVDNTNALATKKVLVTYNDEELCRKAREKVTYLLEDDRVTTKGVSELLRAMKDIQLVEREARRVKAEQKGNAGIDQDNIVDIDTDFMSERYLEARKRLKKDVTEDEDEEFSNFKEIETSLGDDDYDAEEE